MFTEFILKLIQLVIRKSFVAFYRCNVHLHLVNSTVERAFD